MCLTLCLSVMFRLDEISYRDSLSPEDIWYDGGKSLYEIIKKVHADGDVGRRWFTYKHEIKNYQEYLFSDVVLTYSKTPFQI
jgi:hypothetical protein